MEFKKFNFFLKNDKVILLIIPVLLLFTAFALMFFVLFSSSESTEPEESRSVQAFCPDFTNLDEITNYLEGVLEKYELYEYEKEAEEVISTEKYEGMRWEDDDGEIGLIKKYNGVTFDIYSAIGTTELSYQNDREEYDRWMEIRGEKWDHANNMLPLALDEVEQCFLNEGFVEGKDNIVENILAFQKEELKCLTTINAANWPILALDCGNIEDMEFPEGYSEINKFFGRNTSVRIHNLVEDFAVITRSHRTIGLGGGWAILQRDSDGNWSESIFSQEGWDCNFLFDLGVPPKLFDGLRGTCDDYTVKDFQSPERTREYSDFYEEKKN